jgi:hypothetical protein
MLPDFHLLWRIFRLSLPLVFFGVWLMAVGCLGGIKFDADPTGCIVVGAGTTILGAFFGIGMAVALGFMQAAHTMDARLRHNRWGVIRMPLQEAKGLCLEAMRAIHKSICIQSIEERGPDEVLVKAKKGGPLQRANDVIFCQVLSIMADRQVVHISSAPARASIILDFGSNLQTVGGFVKYLEQRGARFVSDSEATTGGQHNWPKPLAPANPPRD